MARRNGKRGDLEIQPPLAGLDRNWAFQNQPPFTFCDGANVRCKDVFEQRERLGCRPGLLKAYGTQLGSGNPIRLANACRTLQVDAGGLYFDGFLVSPIGADWSSPPDPVWVVDGSTSSGLPLIGGGAFAPDNELRVAVLANQLPSLLVAREVTLDTSVTNQGSIQSILMDMDPSTPKPALSVRLRGTWGVGTTRELTLLINEVEVTSVTSTSGSFAFLRLSIDSLGVIRGYWADPTVASITHMPLGYAAAGGRVGIALKSGGLPGSQRAIVLSFKFTYTSATLTTPSNPLMASSNGLLYQESTVKTMVPIASSLTLASDRMLSSVNYLQTLYIADYKLKRSRLVIPAGPGTDAVTAGAADKSVLTDTAVSSWNDLGIVPGEDRLEIINATGGTPINKGVYIIDSVHNTNGVTFSATGSPTATAVAYRILRSPKQFDSATLALTNVPIGTIGTPPTPTNQFPVGCTIVSAWLDGLIWTGDPQFPHVAYRSKAGDPTSYLYANKTAGSAYAYDPAKFAGASQIGDPVTAFIPHGDDYALFAGYRSVSIQRGDPTYGGQLDLVTRLVGIVGPFAWCYTPEQYVLGLSFDGLYLFAPGPNIDPQRVSRERLPLELLNVNTMLFDVQLAYDTGREGAHVFVTPKAGGATAHWWFDWSKKALYLETYPTGMEPTAVAVHSIGGQSASPTVIFGGRDGYLRTLSEVQVTDDGTAFSSHALLGPFNLTSPEGRGMLNELLFDLARQSGPVAVDILVGKTPEEARNATARDTYTVIAGKERIHSPRLSGGACFIRPSSNGATQWAISEGWLSRSVGGKRRP